MDNSRWVDPADGNDAKLDDLVDACDPDPALDRTFLKAWEMDASNFVTRLDLADAGIIEYVTASELVRQAKDGCR